MRTRTSITAGMLALVLLGGLGGAGPAPGGMPALAQEASPAGAYPVRVTGTEECTDWTGGTSVYELGVTRTRGDVAECTDTMSDPRVSGIFTNTMNTDCYMGGPCVLWGTHVMDGPEGGWDCSYTATSYPVFDGWLVLGVCPGTGAYEGMSYVFQHSDMELTEGSTFDGVIFDGSPPFAYVPAPVDR